MLIFSRCVQSWMEAMERVHGNVPQLQRHFWAAAYQIAVFRDALAIARLVLLPSSGWCEG
jgi:hypothetical protein